MLHQLVHSDSKRPDHRSNCTLTIQCPMLTIDGKVHSFTYSHITDEATTPKNTSPSISEMTLGNSNFNPQQMIDPRIPLYNHGFFIFFRSPLKSVGAPPEPSWGSSPEPRTMKVAVPAGAQPAMMPQMMPMPVMHMPCLGYGMFGTGHWATCQKRQSWSMKASRANALRTGAG